MACSGVDCQEPPALYIPEEFAHGFQTLMDNTEVFYQMSEFFHPECARGVRWNDPEFNIVWPNSDPIVSSQDNDWELLRNEKSL